MGANAWRVLPVLLRGALLVTALPAHAARPMITDDARVVEAKACQVESWVRRNRGSTEFWALPACNPTGNLELTAGGARTNEAGTTRTTDQQLQAKTLFKAMDTDGWGAGLAVGTVGHPGARRDTYAYVPVSWSFLRDRMVVHANAGAVHVGDDRKTRPTWGLATEVQLDMRNVLVVETFSPGAGAFHQLGLRHWLVPNRVQVDVTYGDRNRGGSGERWFSLGLRLLSPPILP
jgi:hypothetical protein